MLEDRASSNSMITKEWKRGRDHGEDEESYSQDEPGGAVKKLRGVEEHVGMTGPPRLADSSFIHPTRRH